MRKLLILLCSLALCFIAQAQDSFFMQNKKAADLYKAKRYEQAVTVYESMLSGGKRSAQIFYNLGNAYYKSGEIGRSILNYERALKLKPNYSDTQYNLRLAQMKIIDQQYVENEFVFERWLNTFNSFMSSNVWAVWSVVVFIACLVLLFVYMFSKQIKYRKQGFVGAIIALCISLLCLWMSYRQKSLAENDSQAIVLSSDVTIVSTPDEQGTHLLELHEGVKVQIKSTLDVWVEIELPDGKVGWLKDEDIERI